MKIALFQPALKVVLAAVPELAGLPIILELDDEASATDLAGQDDAFEDAISKRGFVIVISTPRAEAIDTAKLHGAIHLRLLCQIAFIENPKINRAAVDPAQPDIIPANRKPLVLIRAAIAALLAANFEFPSQPITSPEQDLEGLDLHGLLVTAKDDIRASS